MGGLSGPTADAVSEVVAEAQVALPRRRASRRLSRVARAARTERAVVAALALLAATALYGAHVTRGGRYLDDWWLGAYIRFPHALGFAGPADYLSFYSGPRPGAILYWLVTYDLFGFHDSWHRGASVALAGGLAAVFYALLRELRLGRVDAAAIALLSLALPVADAIHFWITPAVGQLCLAACAAGLLVGLRALDASGQRAIALHASSLALLAASLLIAETMLPAIALSLLVYRTRTSWRRALDRAAADLVLVGIAIVHYALDAPLRRLDTAPGASALDRARTLLDQLVTLFTSTLAPFAPTRVWVLAALAAVAALVVVRARTRREIDRRWLVAAGLAAIFAAASYVIYVPADPSYVPLAVGVGDRVNIGALLPLSVLLYAVLRIAGGLAGVARLRVVVTVALFGVLLSTAVVRLERDRALWDQAASEQRLALSALHHALPDPPRGSALLVFGVPGVVTRFAHVGHASVNQPVPVFSTWWELDVAVKLSYGRPDLQAYPIWGEQAPQIVCGADDVYQLGLDGVRHALAYGRVYAIDAVEEVAVRLDGQRQCERVTADSSTVRYDLPV